MLSEISQTEKGKQCLVFICVILTKKKKGKLVDTEIIKVVPSGWYWEKWGEIGNGVEHFSHRMNKVRRPNV